MTERGHQSPNAVVDQLQTAIDRIQETNRLEAMMDSSIVDPEIHLSDEELDEFLKTFSVDDRGEQVEKWIRSGSQCESTSTNPIGGRRSQCLNKAVGSVDWNGVSTNDSILSCRGDIRGVYAETMDSVRLQGLSPNVTINGRQLPSSPKDYPFRIIRA